MKKINGKGRSQNVMKMTAGEKKRLTPIDNSYEGLCRELGEVELRRFQLLEAIKQNRQSMHAAIKDIATKRGHDSKEHWHFDLDKGQIIRGG